jgi:acyl-CoA thioesterase FadM
MPLLSTMPPISTLASWRTLAVVFVLVNLKSLPLAWHVRLLYRMVANWYTRARVQRAVQLQSEAGGHPLFDPVSIFSRSPVLETDYNLHKSNSTYFVDLDESRTALMTKILVPGLKKGSADLEKEGHRGPLSIILGSVHTSFHREIRPYELYEVRSRVLGWDRKWIVIGSWFVRPATGGKEEVLLASALSKYVVKKGRFTASPERCFTTAGWLPAKPENCQSGAGHQSQESSEDSETPVQDPNQSSDTTPPEGFPAPVAEQAAEATTAVVEKLETAAKEASSRDAPLEAMTPLTAARDKNAGGDWDWHRVEMERIRGLRVAAHWLALDKDLADEFRRG